MKDGGPAFPMFFDGTPQRSVLAGLSVRQWYAGMALSGMLSKLGPTHTDSVTKWAFEYADAMIAEGEK